MDRLWIPWNFFGFSLDSLQAPIGISWNYVAFTKNVPGKGSTINQAFFELLEMLVISSLAKNRLGVGELSPRNISFNIQRVCFGLHLESSEWATTGLPCLAPPGSALAGGRKVRRSKKAKELRGINPSKQRHHQNMSEPPLVSINDLSQLWGLSQNRSTTVCSKRPAVKQGPDLYLEPKWLRYPECQKKR